MPHDGILPSDDLSRQFEQAPKIVPLDRPNGETRANGKQRHQIHLRAHNIESFLSLEIPPREMVLAPILPTQGAMMIYAYRGIGKTFLGLNIGYAIACGGAFLRWEAPKPRRVLYVDGEMAAADMQERLAHVVKGAEKEPEDPDHFCIITPDYQEQGIPDLSTQEGQDAINEHLNDVSLVVVDNLSTLCRSGRENEAESWEPVQRWILDLRRRGISVVLIHHAGKGGQQRGTSKREDILDTVISLKRPEDYNTDEGARFEVLFQKSRGLVGDGAKPFEARMETRDGAAVWTTRSIEDSEEERVRELLGENMTVREIAEETGIKKSTVGRIKKRIEAADASASSYPD